MNRILPSLLSLLLVSHSHAADPAPNAKSMAAQLSSTQMGAASIRLMMVVKDRSGAVKTTLQLRIKQLRTPGRADVLYEVLWPKERKGEAVLLHQAAGGAPSGDLLVPPNRSSQLSAGQMSEPLFGGDLAYQDAIENFYAWGNQELAGSEAVGRVNCAILNSKPGDADHSIYGRVESWIDTRRMVPMRVEKFLPSGRLARRIDTVRVSNDDKGRPIPADLAVHSTSDSETDLNGSRIDHTVSYSATDFTTSALDQPAASGR